MEMGSGVEPPVLPFLEQTLQVTAQPEELGSGGDLLAAVDLVPVDLHGRLVGLAVALDLHVEDDGDIRIFHLEALPEERGALRVEIDGNRRLGALYQRGLSEAHNLVGEAPALGGNGCDQGETPGAEEHRPYDYRILYPLAQLLPGRGDHLRRHIVTDQEMNNTAAGGLGNPPLTFCGRDVARVFDEAEFRLSVLAHCHVGPVRHIVVFQRIGVGAEEKQPAGPLEVVEEYLLGDQE
jgi:hypothetical protein